jgi:biopolymer transport protein ExbB
MKTRTQILIAVFALLLTWGPAAAFAQEAEATPAAPAAATSHKTLFEMIKEGGWVMFPIGACSILTLYLIGDGVMRTSRKKAIPPEQLETLRAYFRAGQYVEAYQYCRATPSPLTNVVRVGLSLLGEGKIISEEGMLGELAKENSKLQTWISYLSVIGVCTPMIGLVGTVTGMIKAFATLGSSGIGDPSSLSAAIGEVLVATASGLIIAIPAFGSFYYLRNRAAGIIHDIQDNMGSLFRGLPYERAAGVHIGDEELYAADPSWLQEGVAPEEEVPAAS